MVLLIGDGFEKAVQRAGNRRAPYENLTKRRRRNLLVHKKTASGETRGDHFKDPSGLLGGGERSELPSRAPRILKLTPEGLAIAVFYESSSVVPLSCKPPY